MVTGMVTSGVVAGVGRSPKDSGAGQLEKVGGTGLGCAETERALGALARLSTGSGVLFLEFGVLTDSRAKGALGSSLVTAPSSRTAALSDREITTEVKGKERWEKSSTSCWVSRDPSQKGLWDPP